MRPTRQRGAVVGAPVGDLSHLSWQTSILVRLKSGRWVHFGEEHPVSFPDENARISGEVINPCCGTRLKECIHNH